jgi:hypothetical protein
MHASTGRDITTATKMHFIADCGQGINYPLPLSEEPKGPLLDTVLRKFASS